VRGQELRGEEVRGEEVRGEEVRQERATTCHGLSQSSGMKNAPSQQPPTTPAALRNDISARRTRR
jgi:hypothetical protein